MTDSNFSCKNADNPQYPVLLSVPHGGRDYPAELLSHLRIPPQLLIRLEDRYADLLTRQAQDAGFTVITASRPRAWMDLNRSESDIDREMIRNLPGDAPVEISAKQRGGLGLIPRRLSQAGDIWKGQIEYSDVEQRITQFHRPYHEKVSALMENIRAKFGAALLLDIHSMPPVKNFIGERRPDFVVGDRFGSSASPLFAGMLEAQLRAEGYHCTLNHPYSGDYILRRHGAPKGNLHAIQLETCRSLYLDQILREPTEQLANIQRLITGLAHLLAQSLGDDAELLAAE